MPSGENIDQHKTVRYIEAEAAAPAVGQFTAAWAADGRSVTVSGRCPACGGLTAMEFPTGIAGSKGFRGLGRPAACVLPSPVWLFCECGHAHDERPTDALDKGCGRFWPVCLPDDARRPSSRTGQP